MHRLQAQILVEMAISINLMVWFKICRLQTDMAEEFSLNATLSMLSVPALWYVSLENHVNICDVLRRMLTVLDLLVNLRWYKSRVL
jgi:hypothetical protein